MHIGGPILVCVGVDLHQLFGHGCSSMILALELHVALELKMR